MIALTIVGLALLVGGLYYRVHNLSKRLTETRHLTADALDSHTTALERFSDRLRAAEYPKYLGTEIGVQSECEAPEDVHYQRPRRTEEEHDASVALALESPLPGAPMRAPESSPFFRDE